MSDSELEPFVGRNVKIVVSSPEADLTTPLIGLLDRFGTNQYVIVIGAGRSQMFPAESELRIDLYEPG